MPVMLSVSDVINLDVGEIVPGVKCILKTAFAWKGNIGRDQKGSVQTAFIKEIDGDAEIKVKLWDRDDVSPLKGKVLWFVSHQGKTGLTGLKVEEDTYENKTEKVLVVKGSAEIARHDGAAQAAVPDKRVPREAVPASEDDIPMEWPAEKAQEPQQKNPTPGSWKEIGDRIHRIGAFQAACMIEVLTRVIPTVEQKTSIRIEDYQAITAMTATIMIEYGKIHGQGMKPEPWKGYL